MEDRKTDSIYKFVNRVKDETTFYKSTQPIAGDGWIVYRKTHTENLTSGTTYKITYNFNRLNVRSLSTIYTDVELVQEIDEPNTWYYTKAGSTSDVTFYVYSVIDGTIAIVPV